MSKASDVVVVGSGVFGLAAAWQLARSGTSVMVLDRAPIGTEASGWALGRIDPLLRGSGSTGTLERDLPAEQISKPEAQQALALESYRFHRERSAEIEQTSGIDLQVDNQPTLQLFYSSAERSTGESLASTWTSLGFQTDLVSRAEIAVMNPRFRPTEFGGAMVHGPYFIDSLRFVQALAASARSSGARYETANVNSIDCSPNSATVHTDQGHYTADTVIVAAGPWTPQLVEPFGHNVPVYPSKGEILRLQAPGEVEFGVHLHGPCSLVKKKDGFAWVAATAAEVGFDRQTTIAARDQLLKNAGIMMTDAGEWPIARHTACFRPATPDDHPIVGAVANNVIVATGGGGSGIVHSLLVGDEVGAMIESGASEPESRLISLSRFA